MKLLTVGNAKTVKGEKKGYLTFIMHLAPHRLSGYNTCPMATPGCSAACLNTAGRGGMFPGQVTKDLSGADQLLLIESHHLVNTIQTARIRRTKLFFENRPEFLSILIAEIQLAIKLAERKNLIPVFRLNGTSDIRWENVLIDLLYPNIMSLFPTVQFYDYTKIPNRKDIPSNYHLTFSLAESNERHAIAALDNNMNVTVVFRKKPFPKNYMGEKVIDGDENDLRFLDPKGVIVGLKAKGKGKKDTSGFVREI